MEPELRGRIINVNSEMDIFNYFCGVAILELVLRHKNQKPSTTACLRKKVPGLILVTLNALRLDKNFDLILDKVLKDANPLQLTCLCHVSKRDQPKFSLKTKFQLMNTFAM